MLVDCPKCGFSQPEDQYCAKCGVDMQNYRPRPKALGARLLTNPFFLLSIVFVLVFAGSLHIMREQRKNEIARRVDYLKSGPVFAESAPSPATAEDIAADPSASVAQTEIAATESEVLTEPVADTSTAANASANLALTAATVPSNRDPAEATTGVATTSPSTTVKVTYALVPRPALFRMAETGRAQGGSYVDFGEFQMGSLRNIAAFVTGVDVLESVQKQFLSSLGEQIWFTGEKVPGGELGVTTKLSLRGRENQDLQGDIELMRSLHEMPQPGSPISQKGYGPAEFSLVAGQGLYVILVLPRVPQYDEGRFSPTKFLRVYRMSDFKQKQSEFVMFFDFD